MNLFGGRGGRGRGSLKTMSSLHYSHVLVAYLAYLGPRAHQPPTTSNQPAQLDDNRPNYT